MTQEFGAQIKITKSAIPGGSGAFEVEYDGELLHSKLKMGHGKCQSEQELDALTDKITAKLG